MEQATFPILRRPALVPGPVFLSFEWTGKPPHKARHRFRIVIPKSAWSYPRDPRAPRFMTEAGVKQIWVQPYGDPDTEKHEAAIREYAALLMRGREPSTRPLALLLHVFRPIPESYSRREREDALAGALLPTPRPDADNYMKLVKDAMNEVVYRDDAQVVDERCLKVYSDQPALRIELREFVEPEST